MGKAAPKGKRLFTIFCRNGRFISHAGGLTTGGTCLRRGSPPSMADRLCRDDDDEKAVDVVVRRPVGRADGDSDGRDDGGVIGASGGA